MSRLKILYVGPDFPGSNGTCWRDAFLELGHDVRTVDNEKLVPPPSGLIGKAGWKLLGRPPERLVRQLNDIIIDAANAFRPDMIFYINHHYVLAETMGQTARYGPNFGYFNDDMFNRQNQSFTFFEAIKNFDCIFTTKSYNVPEFHAAGAPLAVYIPNSYDPKIHFPAEPTAGERALYSGDVAFIGTFRSERADFLTGVAKFRDEFRLNIWGGGWEKMGRPDYWHRWRRWRDVRACVRGKELYCAPMGKAIRSNKIILGLLNHANRDLHTSRSFEIPACSGFMLAERTDEHREYFEEDKEAVYFGSLDELLEKIRYYLAHDEERERIARAGYERCLRFPNRYVDRATFAIEQFHRLRGRHWSATGVLGQDSLVS